MAIQMSPSDKALVDSLSEQWKTKKSSGADTDAPDALHSQAEKVRSQYGYSGGASGSQYSPLYNTTSAPRPNNYSNAGNVFPNAQNDYLNQLYTQKQNAALDSLKAAYGLNVSDLNTSASKIPEMYYNARNQTTTSAQNQSAFNERAAASGLNSGTGGQASLAIGNTLTSNLGALNKQEASSLADIETQKARLAAQYQSQIAQTTSGNSIALAQALYEESVRAQNQQIDNQRYQDTLNANNIANQKSEYANTIGAYYSDYQQEINNVQNDNDPSNDWKIPYLKAARTEKLLAQEAAALKAAKGYSGSGGGGGGGKPKLTAAQAFEAYNGAGLRTPEVVAAYAYYYGEPPKEPTSMAINEVATDIGEMQKSGFTNSQIVANAKSAYDAGEIDYDTYQGYLRATRH